MNNDRTPPSAARLDEHDREEWWDVARRINSEVSREKFESDWDEFVQLKAQHARRALS